MPIHVVCPTCNGAFQSPDSGAGKKARCPSCRGVIDIPGADTAEEILDAEAAPPPSPGEHEFAADVPPDSSAAAHDRRPCPMCGEMIHQSAVKCRFCGEIFDRSVAGLLGGETPNVNDPRWEKVRTGLAMLFYCLITLIATILLIVIVAALQGKVEGERPGAAVPVLLALCGLVALGAGIGMLVGYAYIANVPEQSGARKFAVGTIICLVTNFALSVAGRISGLESLKGLGSLVSVVGWILFILFIRRAATHLGNCDLATSALRFLVFGGAFLAGAFALGVVTALGLAPALIVAVGISILVAAIVSLVWFLRLLRGLMTTIDQRTGRA